MSWMKPPKGASLTDRIQIAVYTEPLHEMASGYHQYNPGNNGLSNRVVKSVAASVLRELADVITEQFEELDNHFTPISAQDLRMIARGIEAS